MTLELVEERTASNLINERLDVEHGERVKLEKELDGQKEKYFNLQDASEKLELELLCAKSDINRCEEIKIIRLASLFLFAHFHFHFIHLFNFLVFIVSLRMNLKTTTPLEQPIV